jgi:hypothetical protein
MKKLFAAVFAAIVLAGCATHNNQIIDKPPIHTIDLQWDCSPKPQPLPDDKGLIEMKSHELFMRYKDAYLWGERCDKLLQYNKDTLAKDQANRQAPSPPK